MREKPKFGPEPSTRTGVFLVWAMLLMAVYAITGLAGIQLTMHSGRIAAVWLPNAMMLAIVLRVSKARVAPLLGVGFLTNLTVNYIVGDTGATAFALAVGNLAEVVLVVALAIRLCGSRPDISQPRNLNIIMLLGVTVPLLTALVPGLMLAAPGQAFAVASALRWYSAHALAMATLAPISLILIDHWRARHKPNRQQLREWTTLILGTAIGAAAIFGQSRFPFLFLACPLVLIAAFRTGMLGTAAAIAIVSLVASLATLLGTGPIMLVKGDLAFKIATLQLFLATCFVIGLPVATVLRGRDGIRRQLQESRDLVDDILENVGEVIFKTDAEGRWVFLSSAWESLTGYTVGESMGWRTSHLLVEEDRIASGPVYAAIMDGRIENETLQQRFLTRAGDIRHIEVTVRRLSGPGGQFLGTLGNISDVTVRVLQERELQRSERRFQALAGLAPVGIFRTDASGQCSYVNAMWKQITGLEDGQWEGAGWASAMHPDDLGRVQQDWSAAVAKQGDYEGEFRWSRPDGSITWVRTLGRPELEPDGELAGFIGVTIDFTESKAAQAALALRERELSTLAQNATDAVMRLALDGTCIYASPSSGPLIGVPSEHLVGVNMLTGFHPDDAETVLGSFRAMRSGALEEVITAYRAERPNAPGVYVWMEANCGLVRDETTGAPKEIIASIRDVTQTKALEADLRDARTRAEQAAIAKSAFLANMSHEIRTPMNGVIGFTELVLGGDLSDDQRRNIELIADSGRAMMRLLNDILDMAKIESGQMALSEEPVSIRHKLATTTRLMEGIALAKGLVIEHAVAPDVPTWVVGDPLRIRQIVLNLIGNAVKFTEEGAVRVSAAIADSPEGQRLRIAVSDSGIGIAPDRLEVIFDQFSQADSSIARKFGGTGLGLAISAELARKMGGSISVQSELGKGSVFSVDLPLRVAEQPVDIAEPAAAADDAARPPRIGGNVGGRVLLAEDHDINQELMMQMARRAGITMDIAPDGEAAVHMIEAAAACGRPYALVLMDMQMPRLDGLSATRRLRAAGFDGESLPIIALTANAFAEDITDCRKAGMQGHLSKPLRSRDFIAAVRRWAGSGGGMDGNAPRGPEAVPAARSLQERYAERKQLALEALSMALREGILSDATVDALKEHLHKIAGTAGFFGEAELGNRARILETALDAADADGRGPVIDSAIALLAAAA